MRRTDWRRIEKRDYLSSQCCWNGREGIVSLLVMREVTEPLTVECESKPVTIVQAGYKWLQVAFRDTHFWATAMFDQQDELFQIYFDITEENRLENQDNPTFTDLYLDIVMEADGTLHQMDRDELDAAFRSGVISRAVYELAVGECEWLNQELTKRGREFADFCCAEMQKLRSRMEMGRMEKAEFTNMCMICDGTRVLVQDRLNPNWPG